GGGGRHETDLSIPAPDPRRLSAVHLPAATWQKGLHKSASDGRDIGGQANHPFSLRPTTGFMRMPQTKGSQMTPTLRRILFTFAGLAMAAGAAMAQPAGSTLLGTFDAWETYKGNDGGRGAV